jgi:hypothetical protein
MIDYVSGLNDFTNSPAAFWLVCFTTFAIIVGLATSLCERIVHPNTVALVEHLSNREDEFVASISTKPAGQLLGAAIVELVQRSNCSLVIVAKFTKYHYIAIISAMTAAALGGISTFLVSSFGWDQCNQALRGFFVGCATSLPFWLTAIQVFKYQETIAKHELIYSCGSNYIFEIKRVVMSPPTMNEKGEQFSLSEYAASLQAKMESVRAIGISFDGSKIGFTKIEMPKP